MAKQSSADFQNGGSDHESIDIATLEKFSHLLQSQPKKLYSKSWRRRQIQKVPPQIRRRSQRSEQVYDPVMVSLGPYHHGKPELRRAEEFKHLCLDRLAGCDQQRKAFLYSKILEKIEETRDSYDEVAIVERYDDESLALMMLLDASIVVDFIHNFLSMDGSRFLAWHRCLGARSGPLMVRDLMVMENQIPFRVLRLLIGLQYEAEEAVLFIPRFLSQKTGMEVKHVMMSIQENEDADEDQPLHFLEALRRVIVTKRKDYNLPKDDNGLLVSGFSVREERNIDTEISYMHRSVMDLKAKGIRVVPNSTRSLQVGDITFKSKGGCFSQLQLPVLYVSDFSSVVWSNMIAFEVLPNSSTNLVVLSHAIMMKSLIQKPEDVKELQEKGILLNRLANLEKVVELFKGIDTFGLHDHDVFKDVKRAIEEHCKSRARTWMAELIYTRFQNPWTAIAFFAAVLLLCLTFLQTFFTIHNSAFNEV